MASRRQLVYVVPVPWDRGGATLPPMLVETVRRSSEIYPRIRPTGKPMDCYVCLWRISRYFSPQQTDQALDPERPEAWRVGWARKRAGRRSTVNNPGSTRMAIVAATITITGHTLVWERLLVPFPIHPAVDHYFPEKEVQGHMLSGLALGQLWEFFATHLAGPYYHCAL